MIIVTQDRSMVEFAYLDFFIDERANKDGSYNIRCTLGEGAYPLLGVYGTLEEAKDVLVQIATLMSTDSRIYYMPQSNTKPQTVKAITAFN